MTGARLAGFLGAAALLVFGPLQAQTKRLVVIKVDGLPEELLEQRIGQLPWIHHVFVERGARVRNFYVRGLSLSAPSWSILDTGRHAVIRGNAEFDRFVPRVYDYLNFVPFYVGYARSRRVDMPGVEVLDQAGIPLLLDCFPKERRYQSMQLYQRGVRWETLARSLRGKIARPVKNLIDEWQTGFDMGEGIEQQQERELIAALANPAIDYLDYFTGEVDHTLHLTSDAASGLAALRNLDGLVGRIWTAVQASSRAADTVLVMVSDHGMNATPGINSQGYNLVGFFNSAAGGAHHVVTIRHPRGEYKLRGLDPLVSAVVTPALDSSYLGDEKDSATALLDLDGNERASVQLRNSDLNELQILWKQLRRSDIDRESRQVVRRGIGQIVDRNRAKWSETTAQISEELPALRRAIERQQAAMERARDSGGAPGEDARRQAATLEEWRKEERGYAEYVRALQRLLQRVDSDEEPEWPLPKGVMGESNTAEQLANYAVGLSRTGLVRKNGTLDLERGFVRVNYFQALSEARVRNVVQPEVGAKPVDFLAVRTGQGIFLYGDAEHGALLTCEVRNGEPWLRYRAVKDLRFTPAEWGPGFPLHVFEDPELQVTGDRKAWLNEWHSEREWLEATHRTRYSNAAIGLTEYFAAWEPPEVPAVFRVAGEADWPLLQRFAARLRNVVTPDLLILASDHWNFNVRGYNPGGNHGSFFRVSTHSVLMLSGGGIRPGMAVERPCDSLDFVPTLLRLTGRTGEDHYPGREIEELTRGIPIAP